MDVEREELQLRVMIVHVSQNFGDGQSSTARSAALALNARAASRTDIDVTGRRDLSDRASLP